MEVAEVSNEENNGKSLKREDCTMEKEEEVELMENEGDHQVDGKEEDEEEDSDENEGKGDENDESDDEDADEVEVKVLETSLAQNPYDYASHVAIISKLQQMGELERLRAARENMSSKYPLSPDLWLSWLRDEIKLATTSEQNDEIIKLCERAVKDYLSVEVWLEYLQFSIRTMNAQKEGADKIREYFERALTSVGLHVTKGAIIWEAFREFETVLLALVDPTNENEKKQQLTRIGNLFKRQLACPLLDMEKTYEEYLTWRTEDGAQLAIDDNIVVNVYKRALEKLNSILMYEEKFICVQAESALMDAYKVYLAHEKQHGDPARVTVLYERAVADLSLEVSIWLDYIDYLENNIKIESVLDQVYQRASRNVPWCSVVWQKWIRACEKWNRPLLNIQSLLESAITVGFSSAEDYRNVWMKYLECLRRKMDENAEEKEKHMEVIRNAFNKACEHLAKVFGLEGDPNCVILQYWARTEAIHGNNMEKARTLWTDIFSQGHSRTASYWLEYISVERCYGDTKHLRKLYQKALSSVKDWPESIANSWLDFERDEGTLQQVEFCEEKIKDRLEKVAEERAKVQQDVRAAQSDSSSSCKAARGKKRKLEDGKWKNLSRSPPKIVKMEERNKAKLREGRLNLDKKMEEDKVEEPKAKIPPPPGLKLSEKEKAEKNRDIDDRITVFVSNLDYSTTEEEVTKALESAGLVTQIRMIKDYKGRSKGYCYVQLGSIEAVEKALTLDRTRINGRPMFVSRCDPDKSTRSSGFKYSSNLEKNKLFVKGLPITTTKEDLEQIFKIHGALKEVRLVTYRNGHSKGLAYVEFSDESSAGKALLATDGMKIQDRVISVAISQPPERKRVEEEAAGSQERSLGGSETSSRTFGVPKTLLSMVPRSVKTNVCKNDDKQSTGNGLGRGMSNQDFRDMFLNKK